MAEQEKAEENAYGGTEGRDAMYVKFISSDDFEFIIKTKYAFSQKKLKDMVLATPDVTTLQAQLNFPSYVVERVCAYLMYKVHYTNSPTEIPEFPFSREVTFELLTASYYLTD